MTIVYIDDDADDCFIMKEALKSFDQKIKCLTFTKSIDGIEFLKASTELPDFVILDINMPMMNGKDCLIEIKRHKKLTHIPVVMFSTAFQTTEMSIFLELGAHHLIAKPNTVEELHTALHSIVDSQNEFKNP